MKLNSHNRIRKQFNNNDIYNDVINIINQSRQTAYRSIDIILLKRNWMIGKRIKDEELKDKRKENYGLEIIKNLSKKLTRIYGTGFSQRNLYYFYKFYLEYKTFCKHCLHNPYLVGLIIKIILIYSILILLRILIVFLWFYHQISKKQFRESFHLDLEELL